MKLNRKQTNRINRVINALDQIKEIANSLSQLEDGYGNRLYDPMDEISIKDLPKTRSLVRNIRQLQRTVGEVEMGLNDVEHLAGDIEFELNEILDENQK